MIQKIKKPVSILLTVLMVFSVFAVVPFAASAAELADYVMVENLRVGDILGGDVRHLANYGNYTLTLEANRYGDYFGKKTEATVTSSFDFTAADGSDPVSIFDTNGYNRYYPYDENGNRCEAFIVTAVDHSAGTFSLAGYSEPDNPVLLNSSVKYRYYNGEYFRNGNTPAANTYKVVSDNKKWTNGNWYVVTENVTFEKRIEITGTVNLVLCDGATLTAKQGISVNNGDYDPRSAGALNIYAQNGGTGTLFAGTIDGTNTTMRDDPQNAAIGGNDSSQNGSITIHGGNITAIANKGAAGIGGGRMEPCSTVTVYGGNVTAGGTGGYGSGIGGGYYAEDGSVNVAGGHVIAYGLGGETAAAIGNTVRNINLTVADGSVIKAGSSASDAAVVASANDALKKVYVEINAPALPQAYDITWKMDNGSVIYTTTVVEDDTPTHADPTKPDDDTNTYTFSGWTPEVVAVTGDATYTAKFTATPYVASVTADGTTTKYTDFETAVSNWTDGSTLTLLADVERNSTINISGTKILDLNGHGIKMTGNGSVINVGGANLTLNDSAPNVVHKYTIANPKSNGAGLAVVDDANGNTEFTGGYITGGSTDYGGGVLIDNGTLTMNGGVIIGNQAQSGNSWKGGGGVLVRGTNGKFTMTGGALIGNETQCGGALSVNDSSEAIITGGEMKYNSSWGNGGAINTNGNSSTAKITMSGGSITNNWTQGNAYGQGGGVQLYNTKLSLSGSPKITGNLCGSATNNVYFFGQERDSIVLSEALADDAIIGIKMKSNTGVFTNSSNTSFNDPTKFFSDDSNYGVFKNDAGQLYLGVPPVASVTDGGTVTYYSSLKEAITAAPNGSTVTLLKDVTETQTAYANNNNTYGGNGNVISGKTITITSNGTGSDRKTVTESRFDVINGGNVTFKNIIIDGGVADSAHKIINNNNSWSYYFMAVSYGSTLTFDTGATVQNYYANAHGVIDVGLGRKTIMESSNGSSTINIKDGSEFKNLGANYGVFREDYKSNINMSGGSVTNCTSFADEGVCAYVAQGSAFNMTGGEITGCSPEGTAPGLIFLHAGQANGNNKFTMTGGRISGNTAKLGGAVYSANVNNTVTVGGSAVATGNTGTEINNDQSGSSNFYLAAGQTMTFVSDNHLSGDSLIGIYSATAPSDSADVMIATGAVKEDIKHIHSDLPGNAGIIYCDGQKDWIWYNDEFVEVSCHHTSHQNGTVWLSTAVNTYDVTFDTDGGTPATIPAQTVVSNSKATKPTDPTKDGYVFDGWYNGDTKFNFDTPITANTNLKAKWKPKKLIAGHSLSLDGNIGINFYLDPTVAGLTVGQVTKSNLKYSFEWADGNALVNVKAQADEQEFSIDTKNDVDYIKVTCHVCAAEMTCGVKASFTIGDKTEIETYSVRKYADEILSDSSSSDKLIKLTEAMLNYGAKAQTKFRIKSEDPKDLADYKVGYTMGNVTDTMIDEAVKKENGSVTGTDLQVVASAHGARWYTTSLVYLDDNTLRHYFVKKTDDFNPSDYTKNKGNYYYVEVSGIQAKNLDKWQTFKVGNDEFKYSALDFAKLMINSNSDDASKNLAKALYWYNQAANEYWKGRA